MSYLKRWRQSQAELKAIALQDSSSEEEGENINLSLGANNESTDAGSITSSGIQDDSTLFGEDILTCGNEAVLPSDSDSENTNDFEGISRPDVSERPAGWITRHQCTRSGMNELLEILREQGLRLPKDARTLLKTPRSVDVVDKCGGKYTYLGIESGILTVFAQHNDFQEKEIALSVNIDGVPVFKSTSSQFWPILCSFHTYEPFIVALYYGISKPNSVEDFMRDFLSELGELKQSGIQCGGSSVPLKIKVFVCDAPARVFLKGIKGHSGYYPCERCTIKGQYNHRRVVLHSKDIFPDRTDEEFSSGSYIGTHQWHISPLVAHGIPCVSSFWIICTLCV